MHLRWGRDLAYLVVFSIPVALLAMAITACDGDTKNGLLLYYNRYSFYSQMVLMALYEKKLSFKSHTLELGSNENYEPWFLEINPKGEVPVLKDDVKIIPDSARIIDYLEDNFSNGNNPRLFPRDQSPEVKQKITYFRELLYKVPANVITMGSLYHPDLIDSPKLPFWGPVRSALKSMDFKRIAFLKETAEKNPKYRDILLKKAETQEKNYALVTNHESFTELLAQVNTTLDEVENQLASNKNPDTWLVTETFTVADISLIVLLERLNLIGMEKRFWEGGVRPNVANFYTRASARESFQKTMPGLLYHATALIGEKTLIISAVTVLAAVAGTVFYCVRKWKTH